ncbi:MAG: cation:proton antiporter [Candidatus Aramenus sp.]|jgi:Kef-type K+ transport system membrane component KefB|nr:cation:proton antiporter [Candidatus Aramenus sp.]
MEQDIVSLFDISLFIFVAEAVKSLLAKYNLPYIVGEIVAGMLIGPYALGYLVNSLLGYPLISLTPYVLFISEFSVILLIFASGLEHGVSPIKSGGSLGFLSATFGALLPFAVAFFAFSAPLGRDSATFLGVAMGATSLAAVVSIIEEEKLRGSHVDFLLSASSSDDVIDLVLLSLALTLLGAKSVSLQGVAFRVSELVLMWVVIFVASVVVVPRVANRISEKYVEEFPFLLLFGLTLVMVSLGFSSIIAAFIAGVSLANSSKSEKVKEVSQVLLSVFGSLFFVVTGAEVNLLEVSLQTVELSLALTGVAVAFKWLGVFPFAYLKLRNLKLANLVSVGMVPRGETGLVVASLGASLGVLDQMEFGSTVLMSIFTTLIGAVTFKYLAKGLK